MGPEHPLARLSRSRPRPPTIADPTVTLVIPVRNEARNIVWVLEQVADEVAEIILVDGNSTDVTLVTARRCRPDVRVVPQQGDHRPGVSGHLVQAARQLRRAARPPRTASAVAGQ